MMSKKTLPLRSSEIIGTQDTRLQADICIFVHYIIYQIKVTNPFSSSFFIKKNIIQ